MWSGLGEVESGIPRNVGTLGPAVESILWQFFYNGLIWGPDDKAAPNI